MHYIGFYWRGDSGLYIRFPTTEEGLPAANPPNNPTVEVHQIEQISSFSILSQ
jgi:hypothetical protein